MMMGDDEGWAYDPNTSFLEDLGSGGSNMDENDNMYEPKVELAPSKKAEAPKGGNSTEKAASSAMMASGNPYLMAAGLGLQTLGAAHERELARQTQMVNNEIARRDRVMQMMSRLGTGMGRLG